LKTLAVAFKSGPSGIDCTSNGILIISSSGAHCLYACDPIKAEVERIAGTYGHGNFDGDALTIAEFCRPGGICVDQTRQRVWIADSGNHTIRYLTLDPSFFVE
jgi:streptogramin lyase